MESMSDDRIQQDFHSSGDSMADAIAAAVIITVVILAAILWITGH